MNVVFLGPPGSGKGTQAKNVAGAHGMVHVSTGDVFREMIASGSPLGKKVKDIVATGQLVPDELVSEVVFEKLKQIGSKGFLLDGYPRTVEQAKALDGFLQGQKWTLDGVVFFDIAFAELVKRLTARRQCPKCKEVYNLLNKPPKTAGKCDACGADLIHRPDDKDDVIQERLNVYSRQTEPVLKHYQSGKGFHRVDAAKSMGEVHASIDKALKNGR